MERTTAVSILVIDDNPADRQLIEEAMQSVGNSLAIAQAGSMSQALAILDEAAKPWPRLIIIDGHLPEGMGSALIARLRQRPAAADTIMVMLSGDSARPPGLEGVDWYEKPDTWKGWQSWAEAMIRRGVAATDS